MSSDARMNKLYGNITAYRDALDRIKAMTTYNEENIARIKPLPFSQYMVQPLEAIRQELHKTKHKLIIELYEAQEELDEKRGKR